MSCNPSFKSNKAASMLERQWSTGCSSSQPSRQYIIICAKHCAVPGGIESLMKRASSSSNATSIESASLGQHPRDSPYPHNDLANFNCNNQVGGSFRSLAGKVLRAAKGTADKVERQMTEMALRMSDQSKTHEIATAVCLVSQPVLVTYPGSARYEEWDKTEEVTLTDSNEREILWSIPIILPEASVEDANKVSNALQKS
jgi:hypothetical protein